MSSLEQLSRLSGSGELPAELEGVCEALLERHARDPIVLDLRGLSDATDFFVIASGDSDIHARAIADKVVERMKERQLRAVGVEGRDSGRWILLDFISVVVHVFLPRVREFYHLERLWGDAPQLALEEA